MSTTLATDEESRMNETHVRSLLCLIYPIIYRLDWIDVTLAFKETNSEPVDILATAWQQLGNNLVTLGDSLATHWQQLGNRLVTDW